MWDSFLFKPQVKYFDDELSKDESLGMHMLQSTTTGFVLHKNIGREYRQDKVFKDFKDLKKSDVHRFPPILSIRICALTSKGSFFIFKGEFHLFYTRKLVSIKCAAQPKKSHYSLLFYLCLSCLLALEEFCQVLENNPSDDIRVFSA